MTKAKGKPKSELRLTWSADFSPLPADLAQPGGGGLKSALLNSTAVRPGPLPFGWGEGGTSGNHFLELQAVDDGQGLPLRIDVKR